MLSQSDLLLSEIEISYSLHWRGEKLDQRSAYYYSPTGVERKEQSKYSTVAYLKQSEKVKLVHALSMTERGDIFKAIA